MSLGRCQWPECEDEATRAVPEQKVYLCGTHYGAMLKRIREAERVEERAR